MSILISEINIYPIKSTQALTLTEANIELRGIANDRRWVLVGADNKALTGRHYPTLLDISVTQTEGQLQVYLHSELVQTIPFPNVNSSSVEVHIFSANTKGLLASDKVNQWFSDYLNTPCRLVYMSDEIERQMLEKHEGEAGEIVSYADEAPILIISEASLTKLNQRLETPITMANFRPNIVVKGTASYAEDTWKRIRIGNVELVAGRHCKRCIFTTINPSTKEKHPKQEPLRTLATYRKVEGGGVIFGTFFKPKKLGKIKIGDRIEILE